ncbi:hypothetical protein NDU88_000014 [Pleurodeles waltl]|uniref:Pyrin domain-containing protein n=1 Tax=Pleurodeles waltl TaxID=8319 RepID=A0AAV7NAN9_PLEWA|nr:hypothetical protein NDU88_000014 [Pleurodeles waltl]
MAHEGSPETATEVILHCLEDLTVKQLKQFKMLLRDSSVKPGQRKIPAVRLENPDCMDIATDMIQYYGDRGAFEITQNLLERIPRNDLLDQFRSSMQKFVYSVSATLHLMSDEPG